MSHPGVRLIGRDAVLAAIGLAGIVGLAGTMGAIVTPVAAHTGVQTAAAPASQFEVASVKPNKSGDGRVMMGLQPGGRLTATNIPLRMLIRNAYRLQDSQLVGGPGWVATDRFDIVAKAAGDVSQEQVQLMMRALLADRFGLVVHNETKELPTYALILARPDGKPGPKLHAATTNCAAVMAAARGRGGSPGPPPAPSGPGAPMTCGIRMGPGSLAGGGMPLSQLATVLGQFVGRIVQDKTGLAGEFDFDLSWTPEQMPQGPPPGGNAPALPPIDPNGPSIYTAIQEQLGLKLDSARAQVDVVVIDRVSQPSPD